MRHSCTERDRDAFFERSMIQNYSALFSIKYLQYTPTGYIITENEVIKMEDKGILSGNEVCCCSHKTKERSDEEYKKLINRLNRIEGQVRGVRRMLENNAYCTDILIQVSAINAALNSFNKMLLADHIRTCVAEDIRSGKDDTIDDLVVTLQKLMK